MCLTQAAVVRYVRALGHVTCVSLLFTLSLTAHAQLLPKNFTIEGRLYDNSTTPPVPYDDIVDIRLEIVEQGKTCVFYREFHDAIDLRSTDPDLQGRFSLKLGGGTTEFGNLMTAFEGAPTGDSNGDGVADTAGDCSAAPAAGSNREVRIWVKLDSAGSFTTPLSPNTLITSVPSSLVAETLQGKLPSQFLQVKDDAATDLSQSNLENIFSATNYAKLQQLLTNSFSSSYSFNGQVISNVGSPTSATDAVNRGWVDSHIGDKTADLSGVGAGTNDGHTIIWDAANNKWTTGTPSAVDNTKLPLAGGTMAGAIVMNGNNIETTGHITMDNQRVLTLGRFTTAQEGGLGMTHAGSIFYNTDLNTVRLWNGSAYVGFEPSGSAGGDLTGTYPNPTIASNAVKAINIAPDAVTSSKILDESVTEPKIADDAISARTVDQAGIGAGRLVISDSTTGATLKFKSCALNEILQWGGPTTGWICVDLSTVLGGSLGTAAFRDVGTSAGNLPELDATGKIPAFLLPTSSVNAEQLQGRDVSGNAPNPSDVLMWDSVDSEWKPTPLPAAPVTSVAGKTGAVSLDVEDIASGAGKYFRYAPSGTACGVNAVLKWDGSAWQCGIDAGASGSDAVSLQGVMIDSTAPTSGYVLKYDGSQWTPATDETGHTVDVDTNTGLLIAGSGNAKTLSVDVGTTANKIVRLDGTAKLPAVDGSQLTGLTVGQISSAAGEYLTYKPNNTACTNNQTLKWDGSKWICADDDAGPGGDITEVVAGTGLTGGGPSGSVQLDLTDTSVIAGTYGSNSEVAHFTVDAQGRLTTAASIPISIPPSSITQSGAQNDQVLKWTGSQWEPATDAGIVDLIAGTGMIVNGGTVTKTLNVDVGTGANQIPQLDSTGRLGLGTNTVTNGAILDLWGETQSTSSLIVPRASTANRPTSPVDGMIRYNISLAKFEVFENGTWTNMVGSTGATSVDELIDARSPGSGSIYIGTNSGTSGTGSSNTALGISALMNSITGSGNTAIGFSALNSNTNSANNTAIGANVLVNSTGGNNTAIGSSALHWHTSGNSNVAIGTNAGAGSMSSIQNQNVIIGAQAGQSVQSADQNIFIGYRAGSNLENGAGNIIIGTDITTPTISSDSYLNIGDAIVGDLSAGGHVRFKAPDTAPADADFTPGQYSIWLDETNDEFELKAMKSDGTIFSRTLAGSTADNLGDHTATENIKLNGNWLSNDGGNEGLRIDNSGLVGIGTSAPARLLHVNGVARISPTALPGTAGAGDLMFDSGDGNKLKYHDGTSWQTVGTSHGTVTVVDMTVPSFLSVSGGPVTTAGSFDITLKNQGANLVFAGPPSGSSGTPDFRALAEDDIPDLDAAKIASGTLGVNRGGTGRNSFSNNAILVTDGSGALTAGVTCSNAGYAMKWDGSQWICAADNQGSTSVGTAGEVQFSDGFGNLNSNIDFFWDNSLSHLGIGTTAPNFPLHVAGPIHTDGQFLASSGSSSAPVYSNAGDTNTGLFFPASDQIAVAAGGAETLRVANGKVGINVTTIGDAALHVHRPINNAPVLIAQGGSSKSIFRQTTGSAKSEWITRSDETMELDAGGDGDSEVVVTSGGRIGIGGPPLSAALTVHGTGTNSLMIIPADSTANRPSAEMAALRYNKQEHLFEVGVDSQWHNMVTISQNGVISGRTQNEEMIISADPENNYGGGAEIKLTGSTAADPKYFSVSTDGIERMSINEDGRINVTGLAGFSEPISAPNVNGVTIVTSSGITFNGGNPLNHNKNALLILNAMSGSITVECIQPGSRGQSLKILRSMAASTTLINGSPCSPNSPIHTAFVGGGGSIASDASNGFHVELVYLNGNDAYSGSPAGWYIISFDP